MMAAIPSVSMAQNYEADSVYYTPIPKPQPKTRKVKAEVELPTKLFSYFFNLQMGGLFGKEVTFTTTSVHGVTIGKKLRVGFGIGYDYYKNWQTTPVYGMASWDLIGNRNKNAVFLQMAYGWASPSYMSDAGYTYYYNNNPTAWCGGRMINPQIGYRIKYYNVKIAMAIGYKFQRIFYKQNSGIVDPGFSQFRYPYTALDVTQDLSRVQLIMSVGWK